MSSGAACRCRAGLGGSARWTACDGCSLATWGSHIEVGVLPAQSSAVLTDAEGVDATGSHVGECGDVAACACRLPRGQLRITSSSHAIAVAQGSNRESKMRGARCASALPAAAPLSYSCACSQPRRPCHGSERAFVAVAVVSGTLAPPCKRSHWSRRFSRTESLVANVFAQKKCCERAACGSTSARC